MFLSNSETNVRIKGSFMHSEWCGVCRDVRKIQCAIWIVYAINYISLLQLLDVRLASSVEHGLSFGVLFIVITRCYILSFVCVRYEDTRDKKNAMNAMKCNENMRKNNKNDIHAHRMPYIAHTKDKKKEKKHCQHWMRWVI